MIWLTTDPRHHFNKRGKIIVIKPNLKGGGRVDIGMGEVETHQAYNVHVSFNDWSGFICEGDKWDQDWRWVLWPLDEEKKVIFDE